MKQELWFGIGLVLIGMLVGSAWGANPAESQAGAWHSCIAADIRHVDGNNRDGMTRASGESRVMVPPGYVPVGGGGGPGHVVLLCRR